MAKVANLNAMQSLVSKLLTATTRKISASMYPFARWLVPGYGGFLVPLIVKFAKLALQIRPLEESSVGLILLAARCVQQCIISLAKTVCEHSAIETTLSNVHDSGKRDPLPDPLVLSRSIRRIYLYL